MELQAGGLNYVYPAFGGYAPPSRDLQDRRWCLQEAIRVYGTEHPPSAVVEAAEVFYEFLSGENLEVQG